MKLKNDEQDWIDAFKRGDDQALSYFFNLHHKSLRYFASRLIQDEEEAEDIVSACFVKLWNGDHSQVTSLQNIKAFLYISCRNACLDYLKKIKTKTAAQELYYKQSEQSEESVLSKIIESEVVEMLAGEIELLPDKCREVFKLIYFEHKKPDEIAAELGISPKTVSAHKTKAIELLKASILKKGLSNALFTAFLLFLDLH
ncbi:RNA polymerase sigma-70 factor, ECF subfamily [Pedobacter sp. ok626]|uniref:RNA polymerase sigma-70 factor n=1 Tax=Pedobacter sp. ok626 TaxID=1761882 RepID=UPI0008891013|nr:RNA polymerase sigma-70 factor [Pedobacter sp. ok626]SDK65653.1 RNA polymerase sigma-70 factor, ECF subfamily [Pedobacter sp. ok626]